MLFIATILLECLFDVTTSGYESAVTDIHCADCLKHSLNSRLYINISYQNMFPWYSAYWLRSFLIINIDSFWELSFSKISVKRYYGKTSPKRIKQWKEALYKSTRIWRLCVVKHNYLFSLKTREPENFHLFLHTFEMNTNL